MKRDDRGTPIPAPFDRPLGPQLRDLSETQSAFDVIAEAFGFKRKERAAEASSPSN